MATNAAPYLGEMRKGYNIGKANGQNYIWAACEICGKQRWVQYRVREAKPVNSVCSPCGQKKNGASMYLTNLMPFTWREARPQWKGGRRKDTRGYIRILLPLDDFFYPMAQKDGCVFEHRLVVAKRLGRCLQLWEIVHHKNGIKDDNRDENLQLVSDDRHNQITLLENKVKQLEGRVICLEAEVELLRISGLVQIVDGWVG